MSQSQTNARFVHVLRWIARLLPIPLVLFVVVMNLPLGPVTGDLSRTVTARQVILALLFPGLYIVGWLLAWRREGLGGALMVLSFPLFAGFLLLTQGSWQSLALLAMMALVFAVPGALFLVCQYLSGQHEATKSTNGPEQTG